MDRAPLNLLEERVQKGVDVRVLGTVGKRAKQFKADRPRKKPKPRPANLW